MKKGDAADLFMFHVALLKSPVGQTFLSVVDG
jgi:hypothetical protein